MDYSQKNFKQIFMVIITGSCIFTRDFLASELSQDKIQPGPI